MNENVKEIACELPGVRTGNRALVDMFKIGRVLHKIMKVMEDEGLNIAEAEMIPQMLMDRMEKNSELHEKDKQFTVHEKLFRQHL